MSYRRSLDVAGEQRKEVLNSFQSCFAMVQYVLLNRIAQGAATLYLLSSRAERTFCSSPFATLFCNRPDAFEVLRRTGG
jgi:hypothetical protein